VLTIDNLPGDTMSMQYRAVNAIGGPLRVERRGPATYLAATNASRYDDFVRMAASIDTKRLVGLYKRFYPLFQQEYSSIGYPDRHFNDRLVEAIDDMLAAPNLEGPAELIQPRIRGSRPRASLGRATDADAHGPGPRTAAQGQASRDPYRVDERNALVGRERSAQESWVDPGGIDPSNPVGSPGLSSRGYDGTMTNVPMPSLGAASSTVAASDKPLRLRRKPLQRRGQVTFNRVLDAAEQILVERGVLELTTNLIASRSGVNISSIYKFFPNKHSVILALFERHLKIRVDHVRSALDAAVERSYEARRLAPSTIVVLRAMLSSLELLEVDQATRSELARLFASALRARSSLDDETLQRVSRCLVETSIALLNYWQSNDGSGDPKIIEEAKLMARSYLSSYLD
jgi:AcrR family transcriptional regulator